MERGASLIEYVLLVALIALAVFVAVGFFGGAVDANLSRSASRFAGVAGLGAGNAPWW